jgi:glutamate-ammonia-ligase adenylyltransferase
MVRARHLVGTGTIKNEITEMLHSFAYRFPFTRPEVQEIIAMRTAIAENSARKYPGMINIKSGNGGITDIDFIAQSYAAHYGADIHSLRHRDTFSILKALASENIVARHTISSLLESYSFLCNVEKAIRIGSGKPVNTLQKSGAELSRVVRLMGFKNMRRFEKQLQDVLTLTKELYDRLMQKLLASAAVSRK